MPTVKIPTPLRQYANGNSEVQVGGNTAGESLDNLTEEHPDLRQHLYTGDGKLRSFVNVYKGDEDIRYLEGQDTEGFAGRRTLYHPIHRRWQSHRCAM